MKYIFFFLFCALMISCISPPDFPDEPVLTYTGISSSDMIQGKTTEDSIRIFFSFTDGDGDLGQENIVGGSIFDVSIRDLRTGIIQESLFFPFVPPKGASNGIEGDGSILLFTTCCLPEDNRAPCDPGVDILTNDLQYEIFIRDRAGNESNIITTDVISLVCN